MDKVKVAAELVAMAEELSGKRTAGGVKYTWRSTFKDGGGEYRGILQLGPDSTGPETADELKEMASQMFRRMEKAGLEVDTPEVVQVSKFGQIVIFQDEVSTREGLSGTGPGPSQEQINILLHG